MGRVEVRRHGVMFRIVEFGTDVIARSHDGVAADRGGYHSWGLAQKQADRLNETPDQTQPEGGRDGY